MMEADNSCEDETDISTVTPKRRVQRRITIEPAIFIFMLAYTISQTIKIQYIQYEVSKSHNVTHSLSPMGGGILPKNGTCKKLNESDPEYQLQNTIQAESSYWSLYFDVLSYSLSFITAPVIGSWSDKAGRKLACVIPCAGMAIFSVVYLIVIYLELPLQYLFIAEVARGGTGNFFTALSGFFAYVSDITNKEQRTYRIVIVQFLSILAASLSQIGIGYLLEAKGFGLPYMLTLILIVLTVLYTIVLVPETIIYDPNNRFTFKEQLRDIYNLFDENTNSRRWILIALLTNVMIITLVVNSALSLTVLYVKDYPFCWSAILIGFYVAATLLCNALGMIVGGKLLTCCLADLGMVQVGILSYMASLLLVAFAFNAPMMFFGALAGVFSFLTIPVLRAKLSKLVTESEQGTVFATAGSFESIGMCFSPVIFNTIYAETVSTLPGLVFVTMAACLILCIIITAILQVKEPKSDYIPLPGKVIIPENGSING